MERQVYYEALCSHDSRFDGKFFVGVRSTGIYCRPVCRVRTPKAENCTFFSSAAEAESAGYRPCLKCRPELAPGSSTLESSSDLAKAAAKEIEANCGNEESLSELATRLGCSDRHLRRVFEAAFHVTPLQYRQTCRLLLAKKLLTDTRLSVMDVAMASGFGSLRRFNTVFEREYKLTPSALRKQSSGQTKSADSFTVEVGYRPPYRWQEMLHFLNARAIPGVEVVQNDAYYRTVRIKEHSGWIRVGQHEMKNTLAVTVSASLLRVLPQVLAKVRRLFDTDSDPQTIVVALKDMQQIHETLPIYGLRVPGCFDAFETSVRAILGQQITVRGASTLAGRFAQVLGKTIETGIEGLTHTFPTTDDIQESGLEAMGELGVIRSRGGAILELAALFRENTTITRDKLLAIQGIGSWTADYISMRVLGDTDSFLPTDYGVKRALAPRTPKEMTALAETLRPWRSYAVMNLWTI